MNLKSCYLLDVYILEAVLGVKIKLRLENTKALSEIYLENIVKTEQKVKIWLDAYLEIKTSVKLGFNRQSYEISLVAPSKLNGGGW